MPIGTFGEMRGDLNRAGVWWRWSDIRDACPGMGRWLIDQAMAGLPRPERRYGHHRYTRAHYEAAVAAYEKWKGANS